MRWHSTRSARWILFFLAVQINSLADAWSLADDCTDANAAKIREAMPNAIAMADYASKRAIQDSPYQRKGTLLQDLLGASSEDDADALSLVRQSLGAARDVASANVPPNSGVIIHCTDSYLTAIDPTTGVYRDNTRGSVRVQVSRRPGYTNNACGGQLRAFEYSFSGGNVIVLCSDWDGGALPASTHNSIEGWRTAGNLKDATVNTGINVFEQYLSYKILHELMHAANDRQFPAALPDGNIGELYGYAKITGHAIGVTGSNGPSATNRQHNADSFALLACGWYLPIYGWVNGQCRIVREADRPPTNL